MRLPTHAQAHPHCSFHCSEPEEGEVPGAQHDDKDRSRSRSHGRHREERDRDRERRHSRSRSRDRRWGWVGLGLAGWQSWVQVWE